MLLQRENICVCVEGWKGQMEAAVQSWRKWQGKEWWKVLCFEEWWGWEESSLRRRIYRPSS